MEGLEKFDLEKPEDVRHLLPSGFLKKVDRAQDLWDLDEFDAMVRVVAVEAENQSREGKEGVANVIKNRVNHPNLKLFDGYDIKSLLRKPAAFDSITKASTPDDKIEEIPDPKERRKYISIKRKILDPQKYIPQRALEEAIDAAGEVYFGGKEDNTGSATYFHPITFKSKYDPYWIKTETIGDHNFYKDKD